MRCVAPNGSEGLTLLELVLRLEGEFRRSLEPIRVTPLQAGVLLYLQRHMDARVTDAATALRLRLPTLSVVMNDLVGKRWVTRRHSVEDRRAVCLSLTRRGEALVSAQIQRVKQLSRELGRVLPQLFVHLRGCYTGQSVYDFRKA